MAQSKYFQRVNARRYNTGNDVNRGLQVGQEVGKLLGGLAGAIKGAQKDSAANALMTQQNISAQPGAGQTQDLGTLDGAPSGDGTTQDLGKAAAEQTFTNPATGDIQPVQDPNADSDLASSIAAARLGSSGGPSVGSTIAASQPAAGGDNWNLSSDMAAGPTSTGKGTVGGLIGTGGVEGMKLQQEMAAQKLAAAKEARAQQMSDLSLADAQAKAAGTGRYALEGPLARAKLLEAQRKATGADKPVDLEKNPPPAVNLDTEPVVSQGQLVKTIDGDYGTGAHAGLMRTINEPETIPNPKAGQEGEPETIPNPNGPQFNEDKSSITLGPKSKRITMTTEHAKILAKQQNSVNFKKGLPLIRVPGEDQTQGSQENPYPVTSKLDMVSRAHGTWVKLPPTAQFPQGQIKQVP